MCYTIPLTGAIVTSFVWRRKREVKIWWLNLLFYGGALFGVIDHLWNGELFLISENIVKDLLLGVVITVSLVVCWVVILALSKVSPTLVHYANRRS